MPLISKALWNRRTEAEIDWSPMEVALGSAYPRLGINRWAERIGLELPAATSKLDCNQVATDDWEFTLDATSKLRCRRVTQIDMPDGSIFAPEHGALKIDFVLSAKPASNRFPMRLELPTGARMEYQPELTPDEIKMGSVRPAWCVHSYALYSARGCKLGHFPRPFAYELDNPSNWTWGEWEWNPATGILAKVIPQAWLDSAAYPVLVDDTFGQTSVGGSSTDAGANVVGGHGPYSPALDGTVDSVAFCAKADETGTQVTLGVYNDSSGPASLLVDSAGGAGVDGSGSPAWCIQDMDSNPDVYAANQYWLGRCHDAVWTIAYDASVSIDWKYKTSTYSAGSLPNPFPTGPYNLDWEVSIYATYTTGGNEQTASLAEVVASVAQPSVAATWVLEVSASLTEVVTSVAQPSVTATRVAEYTASLATIVAAVAQPAVGATHIAEYTASVAIVVATVAQPAVTANAEGEETASFATIVATAGQPAVTATYQSDCSASVSAIVAVVDQPVVSPTHVAECTGSLATIIATVAQPAVTATTGAQESATFEVIVATVQQPAITPQYLVEFAASLATVIRRPSQADGTVMRRVGATSEVIRRDPGGSEDTLRRPSE